MDVTDECLKLNVPNYDTFYHHPSGSIHHNRSHDSHNKIIVNYCAYNSYNVYSDVSADHHADNPCQLHVGGNPAVPGQRLD